MKSRITAICLCLLSLSLQAQVSDTLGYARFLEGTPTLYTSPNGGYAFGTNGYHDLAKAQSFSHDHSFVLRKVLLQFGSVVFGSADSASHINVNVYDNSGFGISSLGQSDSIAPDSIWASVSVPVYQLSGDGSFTEIDFGFGTIVINHRFSIGIDLTSLAVGDTVGLMSTTDGDAQGTFNAWELASNNIWFTVEESSFSWGLDVDLAIFPVIDENDPAGISDIPHFKSFQLYPNPCSNQLQLKGLSGLTTISIHNPSGILMHTQQIFGANAQIDVEGFSSGMYLLTVLTEHGSEHMRFIKI